MKTTLSLFVLLFLLSFSMNGQQNRTAKNIEKANTMKTYLIEREIPEAGKLTPEQLKDISLKSCTILKEMRPTHIQWLHSYITQNKVYCVYKAQSEELIKEHAQLGGFPVNAISELSTIISPETVKE